MLGRMRRLRMSVALVLAIGCDGALPLPVPAPHTERLTTTAVTLVGEASNSCSHPTAPTAHVWCAFSRPGETQGLAELWVMDLTAAMETPGSAPCDGTSRRCVRLTTRLWTGDPLGSPAHPEIHGFEGETLFIYADSSSVKRDEPYLGAVKVWRPGWRQPRAVSTTTGYVCRGHTAAVAYCLDGVVQVGRNVEFDLLAGPLASDMPPMPKILHLQALGSRGQVMWGAAFSPDGKHLALSSTGANEDLEVLRVVRAAETAFTPPMEIVRGAARWQIARDGKKVYYLKGYNYADRDLGPRGTLMMADFPGGGNETELQQRVGQFLPIGEPTAGADQGLTFLQDHQNGRGVLRLQADRAHPEQALTLESNVDRYFVSSDRRYSYIAKAEPKMGPLGVVARTDGAGGCVLSSRAGSEPYLVTFLPRAPAVLWAEDAVSTFDIEGWVASPDGCAGKKMFSSKLASIFGVGDGVVYAEDDGEFRSMTIRHASLKTGAFPDDGGTLVRAGAGLKMVITEDRYLLYTVSGAVDREGQGLYAYGPLP
jgi:hypothetical protein